MPIIKTISRIKGAFGIKSRRNPLTLK